jgi:hypothetical protein
MDMSVDLPDVVEVSVWYLFAVSNLLIFIEQRVELKFALQIRKTFKRKALGWSVCGYIYDCIEVHIKITQ